MTAVCIIQAQHFYCHVLLLENCFFTLPCIKQALNQVNTFYLLFTIILLNFK